MEYDNTNQGAAHPPFETQQLILTGKLDVEGDNKTQIRMAKLSLSCISASVACTLTLMQQQRTSSLPIPGRKMATAD